VSVATLSGRRALVTGAARRAGRALALALAHAGADVAVHYRSSADEARDVVREIRDSGRAAVAVQADLADAAQAERAVAAAAGDIGPIEILVNNVGAVVWKRLDELTPSDWQTSLDGTVTATWHACRAAVPGMRAGGYGRIVNILDADADALTPVPQATPYKIGKTGALLLTKSLARTEAPYGITVNAVSPGVLDDSEKVVPLERIPAGRPGTYADVAHAVLFLVQESSAYVTGSNLKVSGGYLI
jgi:NAD(P)-dependent dehydrogenase (short-subunit alcohol dehydrogenase family)